jgi:magnesium transporter
MQKLHYHQPGTPPATLVVPPEHVGRKPVITLIEYDAYSIEERQVDSIEEVFGCLDNDKVSWINVDGLGDIHTLQQLGLQFRIHPLALEDILTAGQRPKLDEYDGQLFIVLQMAYEDKDEELIFEQVSLLIGEGYLITIQEEPGRDVFNPVRQRLREGGGNARFMKSDYLAYALIDAMVDHYFPIVESLGECLESIENTLLEHPDREKLRDVHDLKQALSQLRRVIWPTRDLLGRLMRDETGVIAERTKPFLRDCYDHSVSIIDLLESYRDATGNIMELYVSSLSMRTSEVMRVLTVISSIFIPLTFVVGIYGMNFNPEASPFNMPELNWPFGYPAIMLLMFGIAIGMVLFFKRKKWL